MIGPHLDPRFADLRGAHLQDITMVGWDLRGLRLSGGTWERVRVHQCQMDRAELRDLRWVNVEFYANSARRARFHNVQITTSRLMNNDLSHTSFDGVHWREGVVGNNDLHYVTVTRSSLQRTFWDTTHQRGEPSFETTSCASLTDQSGCPEGTLHQEPQP